MYFTMSVVVVREKPTVVKEEIEWRKYECCKLEEFSRGTK